MPLPSDTQTWVETHRPCLEGIERLSEHASMEAAWDASTNGSMVLYIIRIEELYTDEVRALVAEHRTPIRAAMREARAQVHEGDARLQDLHVSYAVALAAFAAALKDMVPNPFQQT